MHHVSRTICQHGRLEDSDCPICEALAKAHHAIHVQYLLGEAWDRVAEVPVVKSMHPETREKIRRALMG